MLLMDIRTYLARIKYSAPVNADLETLRGLQLAHMLSVPFENLDIVPLGRTIQLDEISLWTKIIERRRGGFCYELNGLFAWLLKQIGFDVTYLNARVFNREGKLGIEFDNLVLMVRFPDESSRWLADVMSLAGNSRPSTKARKRASRSRNAISARLRLVS